jgi:hypothetical protein
MPYPGDLQPTHIVDIIGDDQPKECTSDGDCGLDSECKDASEVDGVDGTQYGKVCVDEFGNPLTEPAPVAEEVPIAFQERSTSYVREDVGERVQRPAKATVLTDAPVSEGHVLSIPLDDPEDPVEFEVRGIERGRDRQQLGRIHSITVELERAD